MEGVGGDVSISNREQKVTMPGLEPGASCESDALWSTRSSQLSYTAWRTIPGCNSNPPSLILLNLGTRISSYQEQLVSDWVLDWYQPQRVQSALRPRPSISINTNTSRTMATNTKSKILQVKLHWCFLDFSSRFRVIFRGLCKVLIF